MIYQKEIREKSDQMGVLPDTVDKDWVLGHVLKGIFETQGLGEKLVFKGGTCLKKCYFEDYRFSEDLDFTFLEKDLAPDALMLDDLCKRVFDNSGIRLYVQNVKPQLFKDVTVGYEVKIKYWGANHSKNMAPPASEKWLTNIKIDANWYEELIFPVEQKGIFHPYSDVGFFENTTIPTYSIEEILAEKLRAFLQRKYSAARDYYDVWNITNRRPDLDWRNIKSGFLKKCAIKGIAFEGHSQFFSGDIYQKLESQWDKNLKAHLPPNHFYPLETVYRELKSLFERVLE